MRNLRKGFTLLELIVVIVVLGILAAIAIPTFAGVISRANHSSALTTAQSFKAEADAIYAQDHAGSTGVDDAAALAAYNDTDHTVVGAAVGGVYTFTVSGQTATFTVATDTAA